MKKLICAVTVLAASTAQAGVVSVTGIPVSDGQLTPWVCTQATTVVR